MGKVRSRISLILGVGRPSKMAFALAPKTRYCEALGPAPQSTDLRMKSGARSELGLVEVDNLTAYSHLNYVPRSFVHLYLMR